MNQLKNTYQELERLEEALSGDQKLKLVEGMEGLVEGPKEIARLKRLDLKTGKVDGLTIIGIISRNKHRNVQWLCKCKCGKLTIKTTTIINKGMLSCGCATNEARKKRAIHNKTNSKTYRIWGGMIQRCTNPKNHKFHRYGGRGIKVCESWKNFAAFLKDMGECPDGKQIDRINNNEDYTKENCRWADIKTQARNRSNNRIIEINGDKKTMTEWCEKLNMSPIMVRMRIHRGWNPIEALTRKARVW